MVSLTMSIVEAQFTLDWTLEALPSLLQFRHNCNFISARRKGIKTYITTPLQFLLSQRNTLRVTRSAALSSQDGSVGGSVHLGKKGKDFEFNQLPMKVEFLECSARGTKGEEGDADVNSLEKSLAKL